MRLAATRFWTAAPLWGSVHGVELLTFPYGAELVHVLSAEGEFCGVHVVLAAEASQVAERVRAAFCFRDDVVDLQVVSGVAALFRYRVYVFAALCCLDDVAAEFLWNGLRCGFAGRRLFCFEFCEECGEVLVENFGGALGAEELLQAFKLCAGLCWEVCCQT